MSDQIPLVPDVPNGLCEAAQRGILIPFIGAGVSRLAGCPGWVDFANGALCHFVDLGHFSHSQLAQIARLNPRLKLALARELERTHEAPINFRTLLHPVDRKDHTKGRRVYHKIAQLGKTFVTTNYDEWLDEELPERDLSPATAPDPTTADVPTERNVIYRVHDFRPAELGSSGNVIHLHGSLRDPSGMVLTTRDYIEHYANDRFAGEPGQENRVLTLLDYLFSQKRVLFIGYGLEELEILEYVIQKARRPAGDGDAEVRHYLLQGFFSHEVQLFRTLRSYYLQECGIELLPFQRDQKDHDQLFDVLTEFVRSIKPSDPLVLQRAQEMETMLDG